MRGVEATHVIERELPNKYKQADAATRHRRYCEIIGDNSCRLLLVTACVTVPHDIEPPRIGIMNIVPNDFAVFE